MVDWVLLSLLRLLDWAEVRDECFLRDEVAAHHLEEDQVLADLAEDRSVEEDEAEAGK
jgi:hypothetical protein